MALPETARGASLRRGLAALGGVFWNRSTSPDGGETPRLSLFQSVKPFIATAAVIATGGALVAAIFFTLIDLAWIAFLAGVLMASILAMTTQATRVEITSASRAEQLTLARYQLAGETLQREKLEKLLAAAQARLHYTDESRLVMLAFVDRDGRFQYHNRALRNWVALPDDKIDGQHLRDVLGRKVFAEIEPYVFEAAAGHPVRYERAHRLPGGALFRVAAQYLPQFEGDGRYAGFLVVMIDITERRDVELPPESPPATGNAGTRALDAAARPEDSVAAVEAAQQYASGPVLAAINGNEFTLFCQLITPLASGAPGPSSYEVLIRLLEEERSLVPPGAFFALAEEHGLLPQLDRWVISHVLDWMITPAGSAAVRDGSIYFINIATATLSDPDFAEFVEFHLRRTGVTPRSLCVEIAEHDLTRHEGDAVAFTQAMRRCGCLVAISGFGRSSVPLETLKLVPVDFLKVDGSIVRQLLAYPTALVKAAAINRVAHGIGLRTVAEMVEDEATLNLLREMKVDFAQGFGISVPRPLADQGVQPAVESCSG